MQKWYYIASFTLFPISILGFSPNECPSICWNRPGQYPGIRKVCLTSCLQINHSKPYISLKLFSRAQTSASRPDDDETHNSTLSKSDVVLSFQLEVMHNKLKRGKKNPF